MSFGLVTGAGNLTNAGALFADDCPLWQSRLYCTRWDGKEKGDAINDAEFTGNVLMLLREAMNFVKSNTKKGWEKLPDGRKNKPEYAERAVLEAMVNHFIHRDYTVMGGEVHLDIYDDRLSIKGKNKRKCLPLKKMATTNMRIIRNIVIFLAQIKENIIIHYVIKSIWFELSTKIQ